MDKKSQSQNSDNERVILQEDCSEDNLNSGILTLTNKKIVFEKTKGSIVTLSKKTMTERLEIGFQELSNVKSEGIIIKKLVLTLKNNTVYKFGVLSPKNWLKELQLQLDKYSNS